MPEKNSSYDKVLGTGGGTENLPITDSAAHYMYIGSGALTGSWTIQATTNPPNSGYLYLVFYNCNFTGNTVTIFGKTLTALQATKPQVVIAIYDKVDAVWVSSIISLNTIETAMLENLSVTTAKIALLAVTAAQIAANTITASQIAAGTITNTQINAAAAIVYSKLLLTGGILNADINAAAAIAFSKLANLTSAHILVGSGANVPTDLALSGDATLANTGVLTIANAVVSPAKSTAAANKVILQIPVSFVTANQCKNSIKMKFAGTIDYMFSSVTGALSNTDAGTITAKIGGVAVTNGVVTIPLSSALDTQNEATPTAAKTFAIDDIVDFVSAKTTSGGTALLTVYMTKT